MTVRTPILNTDTDSAETFRLAMGGLFLPASALNARTGVLTTPVLTGTGALTATVSPFNCIIDGTSNSLQGSYPVAVDLATTVTITSGNTQARIDLICLQIQDNDYDGSGFRRGQFVVVAGTPSGSPAVPATPANAIALWTLPVPALATTITFSTATAVFLYTAAAGGIPAVRNAADKPLAPNGVGLRWRLDVTAVPGGVSPLEASVDGGTTYTPVSSASGMQKIGNVTLGSSAASMSISVPAGYSALQAVWSGRSDAVGVGWQLWATLNGDTGSNYTYQWLQGATSSVTASNFGLDTKMAIGTMTGSSATANYFGSGSFWIPNPGSSVFKSVIATSGANTSSAAGNVLESTAEWLSTAAITSVTLLPPSGNFVAGSSFTLYGLL